MTSLWRHARPAVLAMAVAVPTSAQPPSELRMIVRSGVTCHAVVHPEAPIVNRYHTGDVFLAGRDTMGDRGVWIFDRWGVKGLAPTCWVRADLTVPVDSKGSADGYARVAEYALARKDSISFEELVEVINLLDAPKPGSYPPVFPLATSGWLQFLRLQLLERATARLDSRMVADNPLLRAWINAQGSTLAFFDPRAQWLVPTNLYWELYEKHTNAPWADAAAWHAAKETLGAEECTASCYVDVIASGPQRYWTLLPRGDSVTAAIGIAIGLGRAGVEYGKDEPPTRAQLDTLRASLVPVQSPRKAELLQVIKELEAMIPRSPSRPPALD